MCMCTEKLCTVRAVYTEDGDVNMKWSCGHEGYTNLDWLKKHCYSSHSLKTARKNCLPPPVTKVYLKLQSIVAFWPISHETLELKRRDLEAL